MELVVDLGRVTVVLCRPEELHALTVRVGAPNGASPGSEGDVHRLGDVLVATNVGRLVDAGQAVVRPDAVRFHAAGQVPGDWEDRFARLCREAVAGSSGGDRTGGAEDEGWVPVAVAWPSANGGGGSTQWPAPTGSAAGWGTMGEA